MSAELAGLLGLGLLLLVFLTGMPVAYAMALVGWLGFAWLVNPAAGLKLLARDMYSTFTSYGLIVIPLFTFMGQLALAAGVSSRLYQMAYRFTGSTRGGLAMATCLACTAFGSVCGSSSATAATMATVGLPEMRRYGYSPRLAAGTVAAGGSMGMLMPPSVVLIVYGVITQESIGRLFVAGVLPAVIITGLLMAAVALVCARRPEMGPAGQRFTWGEKLASLWELGEVLAVFGLVMGGLVGGLFTPTEAGAVGSAGLVLVGLARRQLTWGGFWRAVTDTLWTSCMTLMLVAGAVVFGHFLAVTRLPFALAHMVQSLDWPGGAVMAAIVAVYLVGGCFVDALALIMLTVPIFSPVVSGLGYDPIWFGVIIVLVTQMGVITPPVGINVYVVHGVDPSISLADIFRGSAPFLWALIAGTALFILWPRLILVLPDLVFATGG
ncbi:MAG: TRAP transporter large permease [Deltaproteobacteria bacterium]|nr:TRAP transporter large permease [Deltaproteobacteria bacterium]